MDPQQRLLLEVAWEALENAAIPPDSLTGASMGIFLGISGNEQAQVMARRSPAEIFDGHFASGQARSIASGRLAYFFGTTGPCLSINTACSSSLVAVYQACQSLHAGECRMALAGGVNVILSPETTAALSHSRMLSPTDTCRAFDAGADGFVRGKAAAWSC